MPILASVPWLVRSTVQSFGEQALATARYARTALARKVLATTQLWREKP